MADENTSSDTDAGGRGASSAADRLRDMGEQARKSFQDQVVAPAQRAGEALRESGQKIANNNATLGLKVIDQAENNAHEAFSAMRRAAAAKDLSDVMRIHGDFLREQGSRSMAQAREIGELIMQFGRDAVGGAKGEQK